MEGWHTIKLRHPTGTTAGAHNALDSPLLLPWMVISLDAPVRRGTWMAAYKEIRVQQASTIAGAMSHQDVRQTHSRCISPSIYVHVDASWIDTSNPDTHRHSPRSARPTMQVSPAMTKDHMQASNNNKSASTLKELKCKNVIDPFLTPRTPT